jgi:hypothetical protein
VIIGVVGVGSGFVGLGVGVVSASETSAAGWPGFGGRRAAGRPIVAGIR